MIRPLLILSFMLLAACAKSGQTDSPASAEPTCEIKAMSVPYVYGSAGSMKSDMFQCKGAEGETCTLIRAVNHPEFFATDCSGF